MLAVGLILPATAQLAWAAPRSSARHHTLATACADSTAATSTSDARLGAGVSLSTGRQGNLFPAGAVTQLRVSPPTSGPASQRVRLEVVDSTRSVGVRQASLRRGEQDAAAASTPRSVRVPNQPGWYQVRAERISRGQVVRVTCLWYGVAMPGSALDLDTLPAGKDWGGPGPLRDVALSSELGLNVVRYQLSVADFLANPQYANPELDRAARRAQQLRLRFVVQIGQGASAETAAVKHGTWAHLVRRIVAAYPAVRYWEAWNEPNCGEFFYGSTKTYVRRVLQPAARAVHQTSRSAKVVGGSAIGDDTTWWKRFASLGGFRDLDAVGVNPYTDNLGAPESQGLLAALRLVHRLAKTHGGAGKPILDTESAWPSSYPHVRASLTSQSDYVARKFVLERALGVSSGEYLIEGGYQDWDIIDYYRGVKPAAMALSATATLLAKRHFLGWVKTGASHVFAARFSGTKQSSRQLVVAWSSGRSTRLHLRGPASGFNSFGAPESFHHHLLVTGALRFLSVRAGSHVLS